MTPEQTRILAVGAVALAAGFGGGYLAGMEQSRQSSLVGSDPTTVHAEHTHAPAGGPGAMPEPRRGHTFTGEVDVPPHGELGHTLAAKVLGDIECPCGGCEHMTVAECTCDVAKEVEGTAAHLFERGKDGRQVLTQIAARWKFEIPETVLARAEAVGAPHASETAPPKDGFMGLGVDRPLDVPTGARPKP